MLWKDLFSCFELIIYEIISSDTWQISDWLVAVVHASIHQQFVVCKIRVSFLIWLETNFHRTCFTSKSQFFSWSALIPLYTTELWSLKGPKQSCFALLLLTFILLTWWTIYGHLDRFSNIWSSLPFYWNIWKLPFSGMLHKARLIFEKRWWWYVLSDLYFELDVSMMEWCRGWGN